jgi:hypothetical protein
MSGGFKQDSVQQDSEDPVRRPPRPFPPSHTHGIRGAGTRYDSLVA